MNSALLQQGLFYHLFLFLFLFIYLVIFIYLLKNRVFSHDFTAAILVSQNNETAAMLVSQTSPVGVELFSLCKHILLFQ